ncbi:hypothetical protein RhiirA5_483127 [Rhizophagus irregularis]|uniref:Uncharacterized protein n=2 Tax=Rhizophagus irregularis TaxID=588596 RepID=A0A2I1EV84_9GLOM|nr:hypothetical protein RhiirA5_483127 [Rhizophagus irregularis]PKC71445.1 hypothetical protein RhiirA1_453511 [Rhizophagus irregularis]PKY26031.1 hypothetical protein RhiirB3_512574 [Rhizophagus irregularis]CAB4487786.1 unnamed protein product [Rhizophagus irregularis]CAB5183905.1 unnamed protein product [Rhizophagus irregularis]
MEKQKYLYKNSKCVGGTSSTISLINAWISITGQRNIQKYRSIAYLGGFTIVALATIWFLSQSPTYTVEYDPKNKSRKSDKSKFNNKEDDTGKLDKRSNNTNKSSVGWWSSIREKVSNKLGFGKKSKSQKPPKIGKPGKLNSKKRTSRENGITLSSSKTSDAITNDSTGSSNMKNSSHDTKPTHISKKVQGPRCGDSSNDNSRQKDQKTQDKLIGSYDDNGSSSHNNCQQKDQVTQKIRVGSYGNSSSINSNNSHQKDAMIQEIRVGTCGGSFVPNNNGVKQQELRKLKLKAPDARFSKRTNRENKHRLGECSISKHSKHPEKVVNSTSHIRNVECFTKPIYQDAYNKELLADLETRITETVKKINFIDLQDREKYREFYIPYTPLTLHETFDKIGQERVERYKTLLIKLERQKQEDSNLEYSLKMVQEFFHEKKYYDSEEDDDFHEKPVDRSDDFLDYIQNETKTKVTGNDNFDHNKSKVTGNDNFDHNKCLKFADVLAQDEQASKKRIERNFEILSMIDSYQQQGKKTESNIKKSIKMFDEQRAKCKGATRHLKRPSRFLDEFNRLEDRLMDIERQTKYLAEGLDDMEAYITETLELFNDESKMDNAAAKYGPILIDDD